VCGLALLRITEAMPGLCHNIRIFQNGHFRFSEVLGKSTYARNAYLLQPCAGRIPHTPVPPPLLQTVTIRDLTFAGVPKGGAYG
jgi:hypothetical protein